MKKLFSVVLIVVAVTFQACSDDNKAKEGTDVSQNSESTTQQQDEKKTEVKEPVYQPKKIDPKDMVPPMQAIKDLDKLIEGYKLGQTLTPEEIQSNKELKQRIIRGTFDIEELCRLALGPHWHQLDDEQKKHFVGLMTTLLESKAIFSKEQLRGDNKLYGISYVKEVYDDKEKTRATVLTRMAVPKEKLTLEITYKMLVTDYGWKIFDVIVDDASLLTNYKVQFDRIIKKNGFSDLISRMEAKLNKIRKK